MLLPWSIIWASPGSGCSGIPVADLMRPRSLPSWGIGPRGGLGRGAAHVRVGPADGLHPVVAAVAKLARRRPCLARLVLTVVARGPACVAPPLLMWLVNANAPPVDRVALFSPTMRGGFPRVVREAFRQGAAGPQQDAASISSEWGFIPGEIRVPVQLWQGSSDTFASGPAMARFLHDEIPGSILTITRDGNF